MSEVVGLTLVSHAMTDAMAAGRFPIDEELNALGRRQLDGLDVGVADAVLCGPEIRAIQTAEALGLTPAVEPRLADLGCGVWRGLGLDRCSRSSSPNGSPNPKAARTTANPSSS